MKRNFKFYALIWAILLVLFNTIVFLIRTIISGYVINYDARFWIAWLFVMVAFAGNLLCANWAFRAENLERLFYKVPLITVSYIGLIVMLVLGGLLMLIPNCPAWIAAVVCVAVAAFTAVAIVKADWAGEAVSVVHEKTKVQTQFIKLLTVDAETLLSKTKNLNDKDKAAAQKVYEALRYSDPMSSESLGGIEIELAEKFKSFETAVNTEMDVTVAAESLLETLEKRNRLCKLNK